MEMPNRKPEMRYEVHGYQVYTFLLADLFNLHPQTLRNRLRQGWGVDAALTTPSGSGIKVQTAHLIQNQPETQKVVKLVLDAYFRGVRDGKEGK